MLRNQDRTTGIGEPCGFVPVPAIDETVEEPGSKGIASPQDITHLDGKARHINMRIRASVRAEMHCCTCRAAFLREYSWSEVKESRDCAIYIPSDMGV